MSRDQRIKECCRILRSDLEEMNKQKFDAINGHIVAAVEHFVANVKWRFLDPNGPLLEKVTKKKPLMHK